MSDKDKLHTGELYQPMDPEILEVLKIQPGEVGYDATLGYGGHTGKMLEQLNLQLILLVQTVQESHRQ